MRSEQMVHGGVLRRLRDSDEGSTLVLVVGTMVVLSLILFTTLTYVLDSQKYARNDQDQAAATTAAQSGIEDLLARLNGSSAYGTTLDCTNAAMKGPHVDGGTACGWSSSTPVGWVPVVAGVTDPAAAHYHYSLDMTNRTKQGRITITSTGRANGVYRTLQAIVGEQGASDYVYYTDFESADPNNTVAYPDWSRYSRAAQTACGHFGWGSALHWWATDAYGRSRSDYSCSEITFYGGDVLAGKVFTNDTILGTANTSGVKPEFGAQVTTANPGCSHPGVSDADWKLRTNSDWESACLRYRSVANFDGIAPQYHTPDFLDDTSGQFATYPGCHYVGATRIVFSGSTMKVWNLSGNNGGTAPVAIAPPGGSAPNCGSGTNLNGVTLPIPDGLVIYVGTSTTASARACSSGSIGDNLPVRNDVNMSDADKSCEMGNLYVEGPYDGQVTLATDKSIVLTGDLVRSGGANGDDLLGLVAQDSVEIYHPVDWRGNELASITRYSDPDHGGRYPATGIQVAAAIQTLQHSFLVQHYSEGTTHGTLYVAGSIAQRWRGAVGTNNSWGPATGYIKQYTYDNRLTYVLPPYLPRWKDSRWNLRSEGTVATPVAVQG
jgi:Tfp pilus assembly protein PilX